MKVIYFSFSKHHKSKKIAKAISEIEHCTALPIELTKSYSSPFALIGLMSKQASGKPVDIKNNITVSDDAVLWLVAPIWAGKIHPVMRTFIAQNDIAGKTVNVIATAGNPKATEYVETFAKMAENAGAVINKKLFIGSNIDVDNTSKLKELIKTMIDN